MIPRTILRGARACLALAVLAASGSAGLAAGTEVVYPVDHDGPIQDALADNSPNTTVYTFTVSQDFTVDDIRFRFSAWHGFVTDLRATLTSPDGTTVELFSGIGEDGGLFGDTSFEDVVFRDDAADAIGRPEQGSDPGTDAGPWSGDFRPEKERLDAFRGGSAQGTWELRITDTEYQDTGYVYGPNANTDLLPEIDSRFGTAEGTALVLFTDELVLVDPLEQWRFDHFGSPANSGEGADGSDADFDGSPNLVEYGLGRDPQSGVGDNGAASLPDCEVDRLADRLVLSIDLPSPTPSGVVYEVEASSDLVNWKKIALKAGSGSWVNLGGAVVEGPVTDGRQVVKVYDSVSMSHHRRRLMRLNVNRMGSEWEPGLKPIEQWRLAQFGSSADSGDAENAHDGDHDGSPNIVEYALGRDPMSAEGDNGAPSLPKPELDRDADRLVMVMDLPSATPSDVVYEVLASSDLVNWSTIARKDGSGAWLNLGGVVAEGPEVGGRQTVKAYDSVAMSNAPRRMMTLRVTELGQADDPVFNPIEQWRLAYFGSSAPTGAAANESDYDWDGSPNLVEYGLGRDPTSSVGGNGSGGLPTPKVDRDADRLVLVMDLPGFTPPDVAYEVVATDDLIHWTTIAQKSGAGPWVNGAGTIVEGPMVGGRRIVEAYDAVSMSGNPRRMMSLRITEVP